MKKLVFLVFSACLLLPAVALAQQTGSVSGVILDQTGSVIPGATVRISGDQLPGGRTVQTDVNGIYRFPLLLPGQYTVVVEHTGFGKATRGVKGMQEVFRKRRGIGGKIIRPIPSIISTNVDRDPFWCPCLFILLHKW